MIIIRVYSLHKERWEEMGEAKVFRREKNERNSVAKAQSCKWLLPKTFCPFEGFYYPSRTYVLHKVPSSRIICIGKALCRHYPVEIPKGRIRRNVFFCSANVVDWEIRSTILLFQRRNLSKIFKLFSSIQKTNINVCSLLFTMVRVTY